MEGVIAYFKVCIIVFGLVQDTLLKITDMGEVFGFFDKYFDEFDDYAGFKAAMDYLFINKELLNKARVTLIAKETTLYKKTFNKNASERCNANSPYCFVKHEEVFSEHANFVLKEYNIVDNIKAGYFDPYTDSKRRASKSNDEERLHARMHRQTDLAQHYQDSKALQKSSTNLRGGKSHQRLFISPIKTEKQSFSKKDSGGVEIDSLPTDRLKDSLLPADSIDSPAKRDSPEEKDPVYTKYSKLMTKPIDIAKNTDRHVLCVRTTHTCEFSVLDRQKQEHMNLIRQNFIYNSTKLFDDCVGPFIANLYSKKPSRFAIKLHQIHLPNESRRAKLNYRIKRTSFEIKKRKRFLSVEVCSKTNLGTIDKETFLNIFKDKANRKITVKPKPGTVQDVEIDVDDDAQQYKSDEEFLGKYHARYKPSILDSFMVD